MLDRRIQIGTVIALALATACREPQVYDGPWVAEVSQLGDTTVVRTVSGSVWQRPARLLEEVRIGSIDEETSFGAIGHVAVAEDGSVFLYDAQVPQIYRFDASGNLLGLVGREGQGPGEYTDRVNGMIIAADRLLVADPGTRRLSAYTLDGAYRESFGPVGGLRSLFSPALAHGPDGRIAEKVLTVAPQPGEEIPTPWPIGLERRGTVAIWALCACRPIPARSPLRTRTSMSWSWVRMKSHTWCDTG